MVYRFNYRFFIAAWITSIYVWQRFEWYLFHHRAGNMDRTFSTIYSFNSNVVSLTKVIIILTKVKFDLVINWEEVWHHSVCILCGCLYFKNKIPLIRTYLIFKLTRHKGIYYILFFLYNYFCSKCKYTLLLSFWLYPSSQTSVILNFKNSDVLLVEGRSCWILKFCWVSHGFPIWYP